MDLNINSETAIALRMRANYIETGDVNLSKHDLTEELRLLGPQSKARRDLEKMVIHAAHLPLSLVNLVEVLREHAARVELDG